MPLPEPAGCGPFCGFGPPHAARRSTAAEREMRIFMAVLVCGCDFGTRVTASGCDGVTPHAAGLFLDTLHPPPPYAIFPPPPRQIDLPVPTMRPCPSPGS